MIRHDYASRAQDGPRGILLHAPRGRAPRCARRCPRQLRRVLADNAAMTGPAKLAGSYGLLFQE